MADARLAEIRRGLECGCYDQKWVGELMAEIDRLRPYHDAEIREQAKREQMEADIALISGIEIGSYTIPEEVRLDLTGRELETLVEIVKRGWNGCRELAVAQLRAAYAKAHPESGKKDGPGAK